MNGPRARPVACLILAALLWGSAATFIKYALGTWQPITLLTVQLAGANAVLWTVTLIRGYRRPGRLRRLALLGILEPGLCYALITIGLQHTTAANVSVLSGLESCFVVILAAVFLNERLRRRSVIGLMLAIVGVLTLEGARPDSVNLGDLLVLIAILSAAVYVVLARTVADTIDSLTMTAHQFGAGLAVIVPIAIWEIGTGREPSPTRHSVASWAIALAIGVIGFAASFLLYNFAIGTVPASRSSMILNLMPVFGVISAIVVLGERLGLWQLLGGAVIVVSIFVFPSEAPDDPVALPPSAGERAGQEPSEPRHSRP